MSGEWDDSGYSGPVTIVNYGNTGANTFSGRFAFGGSDSKCDWFNDFVGRVTAEGVLVLTSSGCEKTELKLTRKNGGWTGSASWFGGFNEGTVQVK